MHFIQLQFLWTHFQKSKMAQSDSEDETTHGTKEEDDKDSVKENGSIKSDKDSDVGIGGFGNDDDAKSEGGRSELAFSVKGGGKLSFPRDYIARPFFAKHLIQVATNTHTTRTVSFPSCLVQCKEKLCHVAALVSAHCVTTYYLRNGSLPLIVRQQCFKTRCFRRKDERER
jgi:hypothetical protein